MRVAMRSVPLLLIGFALVGCGKENSGRSDSGGGPSPAKVDPSQPAVTLNIPSMH